MQEILVSMEGIEKSFPGVHALIQARFELRSSEVHALLGENGAGKSTLMKVLTGVYQKDDGVIKYKNKPVDIHTPKAAQALGIGIVHQEFNLMPHLTVAQNVFIGREPRKNFSFLLDEAALYQKTKVLLDQMNLKLDPDEKVGNLTVARQQMVEIAKALSFDSQVLIMDEPTAALTDSEIEDLFVIIRNLRSKGVGIVYISHRLEELRQITDRVTVMRDGQYIDTVDINQVTMDQIVSMMVGRSLETNFEPKPPLDSDEIVLKVENLNAGRMVKDVSFELRRGEILGFAGLMGAGRTEVARAIFGADKKSSGEVTIFGKKATIKTPQDAIHHGIGYLSEDRKHYGVALGMDVETNIVLANMKSFIGAFSVIKRQKITTEAQMRIRELNIKTPSMKQKVKNLSGGNQQKVIIAKWLCRASQILIFDEPTRGIDVGAKAEIYKLLDHLASRGTSIIMISSEMPEILRMSHRIIVMCEGKITGELSSQEATQEHIMKFATNRY